MREEQKGAVKNSIGRIFITALLILIQVVWLIELFIRLNKYSTGISLVSSAIALIVVIKIYGRDMNSAMKMPWMILIMAFPVAGVGIYLLCGHSGVNIGIRKHFQALQSELTPLLPDKEDILQKMSDEDRQTANMAHYISHSAGYPVYDNTDLEFYPEAVDGFLQYLASRLHHAGCHQRKRTRYDVAGILRADIYVCQSCRIYRYHDCGTAGRQVHT